MPPELTVRFLDLLAPLAFQTAASLKEDFHAVGFIRDPARER